MTTYIEEVLTNNTMQNFPVIELPQLKVGKDHPKA
jgi:hypothetical protein